MPVTEASVQHLATQALERAGYTHIRIHRLYPPRDPGGDAEILFRAARREGRTGEGPPALFTAYLRDEEGAEPVVCDGW